MKSVEHLLDVYYGSVGGNAVFLLNLPPDRRGLIHETDVSRLRGVGEVLRRTFDVDLARGAGAMASESAELHAPDSALDGDTRTYWAPHAGTEQASLEINLGEPRTFDNIAIQECIRQGQRIEVFAVEVADGDGWREIANGTVVGYKQLLRVEPVTVSRVRLSITESRWQPTVATFGLYNSA